MFVGVYWLNNNSNTFTQDLRWLKILHKFDNIYDKILSICDNDLDNMYDKL